MVGIGDGLACSSDPAAGMTSQPTARLHVTPFGINPGVCSPLIVGYVSIRAPALEEKKSSGRSGPISGADRIVSSTSGGEPLNCSCCCVMCAYYSKMRSRHFTCTMHALWSLGLRPVSDCVHERAQILTLACLHPAVASSDVHQWGVHLSQLQSSAGGADRQDSSRQGDAAEQQPPPPWQQDQISMTDEGLVFFDGGSYCLGPVSLIQPDNLGGAQTWRESSQAAPPAGLVDIPINNPVTMFEVRAPFWLREQSS